MANYDDQVMELIINLFSPILNENSFYFHKKSFIKKGIKITKIITFHISLINLTLEIGVNYEELNRFLLPRYISSNPVEAHEGHIWTRIGALFDNGKDKWWDICFNTDICSTVQDIYNIFLKHAWPWISSMNSVTDALKFINSGKVYFCSSFLIPAIYLYFDNKDKAIEELKLSFDRAISSNKERLKTERNKNVVKIYKNTITAIEKENNEFLRINNLAKYKYLFEE